MNTKDRILDHAIRLFNESGTGPVSTNHIAEACGISPGNLYYHYRNKLHIIRAILERMFNRWDAIPPLPLEGKLGISSLEVFIEAHFALQWEYRFFNRELIALLRQDDELQVRYHEMLRTRMGEQASIFRRFTEEGVLKKPEQPGELENVLTACWVFANSWITHLESTGLLVGQDELRQGVRIMLTILKPYLAE